MLWIQIKSVLFLIGNLLFHEGDATEKCASSTVFSPDHDMGSNNEVSKFYCVCFFLFTLATLFFEGWFGGPAVGMYKQVFPPSNNQVCKKKSPNKEMLKYLVFS